jgi:hypothetical protein
VVVVRCQHCGARYDTDLPVSAIERIRRCSSCGHPALVADDDEKAAVERRVEDDPSGARDPGRT